MSNSRDRHCEIVKMIVIFHFEKFVDDYQLVFRRSKNYLSPIRPKRCYFYDRYLFENVCKMSLNGVYL